MAIVTYETAKGQKFIVDSMDASLLTRTWFISAQGYVVRKAPMKKYIHGDTIAIHNEILERKIGRKLEDDEECDHKDGNRLNNRRSNLRLASRMQQAWNVRKHIDGKSQYKGLTWREGREKWQVRIMVNGKGIHLGHFADEEDAARAYDKAAKEHFGEFAVLNNV